MSAKEKERAWKNFKKIVDTRDISLLKKTLYEHCHLHYSFIAHYDRHGFIAEYSGQDFRRFIQNFDENSAQNKYSHLIQFRKENDDYRDINEMMVEYCTTHAPIIYTELDEKIVKLN